MRREAVAPVVFAAVALGLYLLPIDRIGAEGAPREALALLRWYTREHFLLCLVPAILIAGALSALLRGEGILRLLGPEAKRPVAYGAASISGAVLAVCSCTILPLFAGIRSRGAGLGPAISFLYAGPSINLLAMAMTAQVLGVQLGVARTVAALLFSLLIGLAMAGLFPERSRGADTAPAQPAKRRAAVGAKGEPFTPLLLIVSLIAILLFANFSPPPTGDGSGLRQLLFERKWIAVALAAIAMILVLIRNFGWKRGDLLWVALPVAAAALLVPGNRDLPFAVAVLAVVWIGLRRSEESREWIEASWGFARQILPLLLIGVAASGLLLGGPGGEGLIPSAWVESAVGGESVRAHLVAAALGAVMYFATLTEIPIIEGLIGSGMGQGPALALLLAGPALSLPSILMIRSILGGKKTATFVALVVLSSAAAGVLWSLFF